MEVNKIIDLIEKFAPLESQEPWDCSGFQIDLGIRDVKKILLCLSVTENIVYQAQQKNCDLIIAHHPLFFIPYNLKKGISIYSAHTNLDKAEGGTTDTLIALLGLVQAQFSGDFLRLVELSEDLLLSDFVSLVKNKLGLDSIKIVNNLDKQKIKKIAFCAGSGADFLQEVQALGIDLFVTGDVKYHQALESNVIIADIGHFESEHPVLNSVKFLLEQLGVEVTIADEKSPFINY